MAVPIWDAECRANWITVQVKKGKRKTGSKHIRPPIPALFCVVSVRKMRIQIGGLKGHAARTSSHYLSFLVLAYLGWCPSYDDDDVTIHTFKTDRLVVTTCFAFQCFSAVRKYEYNAIRAAEPYQKPKRLKSEREAIKETDSFGARIWKLTKRKKSLISSYKSRALHTQI